MSIDSSMSNIFSIKKSIFIRARILSKDQSSPQISQNEDQTPCSGLTTFLDEEEEEGENDFKLLPPDKYDPMTSHLCISIKFWIGGKRPLLIGPCELSKRHKVLDVIKYILTLYRQKQDMKDKVKFKNDETPEAFDLRHPEDDGSDSDDNYEADTDIPALDHNQNIGEFDALVLVQKRNYRGPVVTNKEYNFK